jgi:hypothetical protein
MQLKVSLYPQDKSKTLAKVFKAQHDLLLATPAISFALFPSSHQCPPCHEASQHTT